jgi:pyruvate/2-oxoglutarate/acetoin dehydrogenase E1 component
MSAHPVRAFHEAINDALRQEMTRDDSVIIVGEDVGQYGGIRGVCKGLWAAFGPSRVIDMPIAEGGIAGMCTGAAMRGLRPVVEVYFGDILIFMADQIVNFAAKLAFATQGRLNVPMVVRGADGSRPDGGPHQDTLGAWFAQIPGLKVVVPSTPADAKGLMLSAIRDPDPVIFLEPTRLYRVQGPVPEGDYTVSIGQADIKATGSDVTVVCIGRTVQLALEAAERWERKGTEVEVVDLRSLRPLDMPTIQRSVAKTGRMIVTHEGWASCGIGAEVIARLFEDGTIRLKASPVRVSTADTHVPASPALALACLPNAERIDRAIAHVLA